MFGDLWTELFILPDFNCVADWEIDFSPYPGFSPLGVASWCHNTPSRVQTYWLQGTWCQRQFVFNIWCTWRHRRHSVAGVMCTKYVLLLDIGTTSPIVNGSIYLPLPSLWNCILFFIFCLSCCVGVYGNLCDAMTGYSASDDSVLHISKEFTFVCLHFGCTENMWAHYDTDNGLGISYVSFFPWRNNP
jgi:hypothetical protein